MSRAARLGGALLSIGVLLFVAWLVWKSILLLTGLLGNKTEYDAVRITLPLMTVWDIEFSADSKYVAVFLWPPEDLGDPEREPGKIRVYDLAGRQVDEAVNAEAQLAGVFADRFPRLGARSRYPSFVKDADAWAFSDDFTVGFRVVEAGREERSTLWRAELWRLDPGRELLWQRDLPANVRKVEYARFFEKGGSRYILVATFSKSNVYVLREDDGEIDSQFSCGLFTASEFAFEPRRRLLACCNYASRRVRVLSPDAPNNIIFELNKGKSDTGAGGGWLITDLEFSGEKYLVASYEYAGRLAWRMHQPTEIVRTRDWARVWYEDSLYISLVRVSPDGRWLASVRGELYGEDAAVLEIAPFEGEERDNETDDTNR